MASAERPWSVTVRLDEVGETCRHIELEPDDITRAALAKPAGVDAVERLVARFDLTRRGRDRLHVSGDVSGTVRQTCVVTLEPLINDVAEPIDVDFAPPRQTKTDAADIDLEAASSANEPEPLIGNAVDLGLLATEFFILGVDPYPRKAGVAFEAPKAASDAAGHPFAS